VKLIDDLNEENTGYYAGFISASFQAGRMMTSIFWGKFSDKYGRVKTMQISLFLSAVFSLCFAFAPTFFTCVLFRGLIGASCGLVSSIFTYLSEFPQGDNKLESSMTAIVLGMWGYGFLIGPTLSGFLSDPLKLYPDSDIVYSFSSIFEAYPYILPNIVATIFCLISMALNHFYLEETLTDDTLVPLTHILNGAYDKSREVVRNVSSKLFFINGCDKVHDEETVLSEATNRSRTLAKRYNSLLGPSASTSAFAYNGVEDDDKMSLKTSSDDDNHIGDIWKRKFTRSALVVCWLYFILLSALDDIIPLFCISKSSGLGTTEKQIGIIFAGVGIFYVTLQYHIVTGLVDNYGALTAMRIGIIVSAVMVLFVPLSLVINRDAPDGSVNICTVIFISIFYGLNQAYSSAAYTSFKIMLNKSVPAEKRGMMNGLWVTGMSASRFIGPVGADNLFAFGVSSGVFEVPYGSVFSFGAVTFYGCLVFLLAILTVHERDLAALQEIPAVEEGNDGAVDGSGLHDDCLLFQEENE